MKVGIIGGGAAGLSAAYELAKAGYSVHLFERDKALGGLAGSFMLDGGYVEKFYHFICLHDHVYQSLLGELGLSHLLRWRYTGMGHFYNGTLYSFGRPQDLLLFPHFSVQDKVNFAYQIMKIKSAAWTDYIKIENVPVKTWLLETFGENVYRILHEPLIRLKFGEFAEKLSASWMWARIHRLGKSRTKIRQREKVAYVDGGSQIIMDALGEEVRKRNGTITLGASVDRLLFSGERVRGLEVNGKEEPFDAVLSTVALPALLRLIPESFSGEYWDRLRRIRSIGVVCVFLRLRRSLTKFFWTNISDSRIRLAGVIEFTNLNPFPHLKGDSIVYLPQYLSSSDDKFRRSDHDIVQEYVSYLKLLRPDFTEADVKEAFVFREKYAQPICDVGFTHDIPPIQTPISGFYLTDSSQLHPDDRTISNSLDLGKKAAKLMMEPD
ncbi:MAG TPA: NAD(P)/FAD-dependent oxidoreductase [Acidobacteriota bacterium]|nr:NAD(P)/FAD-dependent oxidoreductase [Acidobacteriota bacterium]